MTLLEWASTWWGSTTPVSERRTAVVPMQRPQPRVPAEYLSLYTYLEHRYASTVVLTFEQMEALLGFALPEPARTERDWWTGAAVRMDCHSDAWTVARRTATPNLSAQTVAFERQP
ncbi:MAG: DUF7662 domain-containing protein [Vicinamibacterales bacterium]